MLVIFIGDNLTQARNVVKKYIAPLPKAIEISLDDELSIRSQKEMLIKFKESENIYILPTVQSPLLNLVDASEVYIVKNSKEAYNLKEVYPGLSSKHNLEKFYLGGRFDSIDVEYPKALKYNELWSQILNNL